MGFSAFRGEGSFRNDLSSFCVYSSWLRRLRSDPGADPSNRWGRWLSLISTYDHGPKILAVDDTPRNLFALEKLLHGVEAQLIQATSGNEALKHTLKHDFGVAIVYVQMPSMDGYELVELMRGNQRTANLPVIFISAVYREDYHRIKEFRSGAVDFLSKPIIPEILVSKEKIFLNLSRQKMELERLVKELEDEIRQCRQAEEKQSQLLAAVESANR